MKFRCGNRCIVSTAILVVVVLGLSAGPAGAAEGGAGVYLPGTFGPQTGILPEPGTYLTNYSYFYTAKTGRATEGGFLRLDLEVDVFSNFSLLTHVTDWTLWGAQYGFGAIIPLVHADYGANIPIGPVASRFSDDNGGLGDMTMRLVFSPKEPTSSGVIWGVGQVAGQPLGRARLLGGVSRRRPRRVPLPVPGQHRAA